MPKGQIPVQFPNTTLLCEWLWSDRWSDEVINDLVDELATNGHVYAVVGGFSFDITIVKPKVKVVSRRHEASHDRHVTRLRWLREERDMERWNRSFDCQHCGQRGGH